MEISVRRFILVTGVVNPDTPLIDRVARHAFENHEFPNAGMSVKMILCVRKIIRPKRQNEIVFNALLTNSINYILFQEK